MGGGKGGRRFKPQKPFGGGVWIFFWTNTLTKQIRGHEEMTFFSVKLELLFFSIFNFDFVNSAFGPMGKGAL